MAMSQCPNCANPLRPGAKFCGRCGYRISTPQTPSNVFCQTCGTPNRATARFCSRCRTPLAARSQPAPIAPGSPNGIPAIVGHFAIMSVLALTLFSGLAGVFAWEQANPTPTPTRAPTLTITLTPTFTLTPTPLPPPPVVVPTDPPTPTPNYPGPVVQIGVRPDGRFGLMATIGDPRRTDDDLKDLTFDPGGETNNTRVYVDDNTPIFGSGDGTTSTTMRDQANTKIMTWDYRRVRITQRLQIVLGTTTNRYDTLRVEYTLENLDSASHQVGLRMMIDTLIGANDGVPFSVPSIQGITARAVDLRGDQIPDFIQALERADLANPGVVVNITLRAGGATPPERVLITGWYDGDMPWDFLQDAGGLGAPLTRGGRSGATPDSAIGLYYPVQELRPSERRQIVAFYGLGAISSVESKNPNLGLSVSANRVEEGASFYIVARISNPRSGQRIRLQLPASFALVGGEQTQPVGPEANANFTTRSWLVRAVAPSAGADIVAVLEPDNISERQNIVVVARPTPAPSPTPPPTIPPTATPIGGVTR